MSDVHLRNGEYEMKAAADAEILLIAGDVCAACEPALRDFLERAAGHPEYRHVVFVKGNHELFGSSMEETDAILAEMARAVPKLVVLNRSTFDVPGTDLRIAGCTLWSRVSEAQRRRVTHEVGDFRLIRGWTLEKRHEEHERDVDFVAEAMGGAVRDGKRLLLMTHHAPVLRVGSATVHRSGPHTSSYECDIEGLLVPPIAAAVFGHTHFSTQLTLANGVRLLSNQRGRVEDVENDAFCDDFTFDL